MSLPVLSVSNSEANGSVVRARWLPDPEKTTIRHRACLACFTCAGGKQHSSCDQDWEAAAGGFECASRDWLACVWTSIPGQSLSKTAREREITLPVNLHWGISKIHNCSSSSHLCGRDRNTEPVSTAKWCLVSILYSRTFPASSRFITLISFLLHTVHGAFRLPGSFAPFPTAPFLLSREGLLRLCLILCPKFRLEIILLSFWLLFLD